MNLQYCEAFCLKIQKSNTVLGCKISKIVPFILKELNRYKNCDKGTKKHHKPPNFVAFFVFSLLFILISR